MKVLKMYGVLALILSLVITACTGQQTTNENSFKDVSVAEAANLIKDRKDLLVLDVRTPNEVAAGKIENATVVDFQGATFNSIIDQLDKAQPVLVYCAVGGRSGTTVKMMKEKGFKEVYNLSGGIQAWAAAGKPLVK